MAFLSQEALLSRLTPKPTNEIAWKTVDDVQLPLQSDVVYKIVGDVDLTGSGINLEVPAEGLWIDGSFPDLVGITCSDDDYTLFTSPIGGSGNLFMFGVGFAITGANSKVFDLVDATGFNAIEVEKVNYLNCTSLGEITNYRQGLEINTARFGGTPELTLSGSWNGFRVTTSIVRGLSNITALFKEGTDLEFSNRFVIDINCDLPAMGALLDFAPSDFLSEELLQIQGAIVSRQGVFDTSDTGVLPNISHTDTASLFSGNKGIKNTRKGIYARVTSEILTLIPSVESYVPLGGTWTIDSSSHWSSPSNGQFKVESGAGDYVITAQLNIEGTANDVIDIRAVKSTDNGVTFPTQINHISRVINNQVGPRDVAFIPITFPAELQKGDIIRFEVESKNLVTSNPVTMEVDSFISIRED